MMEKEKAARRADRLSFLLSLTAFILILSFPAASSEGVRSGLSLCYRAVVPSVFPSLILTDLLFSRPCKAIEKTVGRMFHLLFHTSPRGAVAWVAGLLSGFPVGAITVARDVERGALSREEGEYLLAFVNNTGPAFLVGGIGLGLFGSARLGWALYFLQIPVSLFVGFLLRPKARAVSPPATLESTAVAAPVSAIVRASEKTVRIAGFVCFFSVLSSLLSLFLPDGLPLALASSILEVGCGAARASRLAAPFPALPLVAFSVCFSGLSVHFQTLSVLDGTGIRTKSYRRGKTVSGFLGLFFSLFFCLTN